MVELVGLKVGGCETVLNGFGREASPVFDAVEAFFFDGSDELPVLDQAGGGVTVESVDSENIHKV